MMCARFSHLADTNKAKTPGIRAFAMKPRTKRVIVRTIRQVLDEVAFGCGFQAVIGNIRELAPSTLRRCTKVRTTEIASFEFSRAMRYYTWQFSVAAQGKYKNVLTDFVEEKPRDDRS